MDISNIHDRSKERDQILECEQERRDPQYREHSWQGGKSWQRSLEYLVQRENTSDHVYRYQINEARLDGEAQAALEEQYISAVEEDVKWYERFLSYLQRIDQQWRADKTANPDDLKELAVHRSQIERRLLEREVSFYQVALEVLERHRRHDRELNEGSWSKDWQELQNAVLKQDDFYRRLSNKTPDGLYAQRRAWYQELRRVQAETLQIWGGDKTADRRALKADMKQVEALLATLDLRRVSFTGVREFAAISALGIVLGLILFFLTRTPTITQSADDSPARPSVRMTSTGAPGAPSPNDAFGLNQRGKALLAHGDCDQAILEFQAAIKAAPAFHEPFANMARCLYDQGKTQAAIDQWRRALAIYRDSPDANAGLGMALYAAGHHAEGLRLYSAAIHTNPGYRDEAWLRTTALWSTRAIADSRPLRAALRPSAR